MVKLNIGTGYIKLRHWLSLLGTLLAKFKVQVKLHYSTNTQITKKSRRDRKKEFISQTNISQHVSRVSP